MADISPLEVLLEDYRSTTIGLSISLVLDGSGSMKAVWDLLRLTFREIIDRVTSSRSGPTSVSVVQFADRVETTQEFTSNINEVRLKVVEMKQLDGGTDTREGLKRSLHLFKIQNLPHRKLAIVLTDGGSTGRNPMDVATELKNESINVICIGIGPHVNKPEVIAIAKDVNHAFFLPSMESLRSLFVKNVLSSGMPEPVLSQLRLRETKASFLFEFNNAGAISAVLQVHRNGAWTTIVSKNIPSTKDVSVHFESTRLEEDTEYDFQAKVKLESGHEVTSNLLKIKTRKFNPMSTLLADFGRLTEANQKYKERIINYSQTFKHKVRIGMVGKVGNGKSAASDTIASAFNGEFEFFNVVGLMGETSLTPQPSPVDVPKTNIVILDFFGWDNPDQYESDLKYLIQGLAPDTLLEGQTTNTNFQATTEGQQQRRFYGVFIIISPAEVAQARHLAYVQGLYDFVSRQGLQPIILLTKCDQIDAELLEHPEFIYSSDLVDNYIQQLTAKKFPRGVIFPVISQYEPIDGPISPVKEYLFLSALHALIFTSMKPVLKPVIRTAPVQHQPPNAQEIHNLAEMLERQHIALTVYAREANKDEAFRKCRMTAKTVSALHDAIQERFQVPASNVKRIISNNFKSIIETDDDVADLKGDETFEFEVLVQN
eukprot:TRINITY_DN1024_c0_g1_i1.p1 TRINITY_DN1024_c0_g1~~TRINITY_DN1024_c0_g1_i1.p1  ORF type:complete len:657 (+),score=114.26 TRINITY_DN1024_c0_g1_i1:61-2031(+)